MLPYDKTWHWIKVGLTATSIVFCLILLGISIAISIGPGWDTWNITVYWTGPLAGIAALWGLAEFITLWGCGKRNGAEHRRGIHPGAHVGMDLCIWLAGIVCIFLTILSYLEARSQLRTCTDELAEDSDGSLSGYGYYYYYCDDDSYDKLKNGIYIPAIRALLAFTALLT